MSNLRMTTNYRWLAGSLCIWLFCAWSVQQPGPGRKSPARSSSSKATHKSGALKAPRVKTSSVSLPTATTIVNGQGVAVDAESGLALNETMPLVKGQCTACHSSKLILQSHFDRDKWVERIRWMQRTQKLWDLGETEKPILDYLVKYYGPLDTPFDGRRLPLPAPVWHRASK